MVPVIPDGGAPRRPDALYDGVPAWLRDGLVAWLRPYLLADEPAGAGPVLAVIGRALAEGDDADGDADADADADELLSWAVVAPGRFLDVIDVVLEHRVPPAGPSRRRAPRPPDGSGTAG